MIAAHRRDQMDGSANGADPALGGATESERRFATGVEDMVGQYRTGGTGKPARACFHGVLEKSAYLMIAPTRASQNPRRSSALLTCHASMQLRSERVALQALRSFLENRPRGA